MANTTEHLRVGVIGIADAWSSCQLAAALERRTGFGNIIEMEHVAVDFATGVARYGQLDLCTLDGLVIKKIGKPYSPDLLDRLALLRYIQGQGVRVFSQPANVKRLLDRLSGTVSLVAAGIPMPPTTVTEDCELARAAVADYGRAVLKPLYTSKARGMTVVEDGPEAMAVLERYREAGHVVYYVQKLLPDLRQDLGLAFLGGRFVGCYARVRGANSWNTTTHSGGRYKAYEPSAELIALAKRAQAIFDLDFTCVDVAETAEGPLIFEVSAFGGFRGLKEACGIDAADLVADYVLESIARE